MRMGVAAISLLCSMSAFAEIEQIDSVCDFSTILESDGKVEAAFRFVNHTGNDISIEQVRTTCGCTATRFARTPIHNGDTAVVEVQFNPSGRPGKFEKKAYATFLPSRNRLVMTVRGKVVASEATAMSRYPESVAALRFKHRTAIFGQIDKGKTQAVTLDGYNATTDTISVAFPSLPPHITAVPVPSIVPPGDQVSIVLKYDTSKKDAWGLTCDSIAIATTQSGRRLADFLEASAVIVDAPDTLSPALAPRVGLSSRHVDFGTLSRNGSPCSRELVLTNTGEKPLEIRSIATFSPAIKATSSISTINKGESAVVEIEANVAAITDAWLDTEIKIYTNAPSSRCITVRCVGEIK